MEKQRHSQPRVWFPQMYIRPARCSTSHWNPLWEKIKIKNWFCVLKIENRIEGGTSDFHGLAKVRENKQTDHHWVLCFRGPEKHLIFKFHHVKLRLGSLFSRVVNVIFKNTEFAYSFQLAVKNIVLGINNLSHWPFKIIISVSRRDI